MDSRDYGYYSKYERKSEQVYINHKQEDSNRLKLFVNYQIFTQFFYKKIAEDVRQITIGNQNTDSGNNIHLFQEKKYPKSECDNNLDRYNTCSFIIDEYGNKMFKTRYFDYPWV